MLDIDGTITHNDLLSVCEKAGAHFHRVGSEWRGPCPLHNGSNDDAFAIYTSKTGKEMWKCFSGDCGGGDIIDFVTKWRGCSFVDAYLFLGGDIKPDAEAIASHAEERAARAISEMEIQIARAQSVLNDLRQAQTWIAYHHNLEAQPETRDLWSKRGIPEDWQDFWKLGYCPSFRVTPDYVSPSLTIPVFGQARGEEWPLMNVRHRLLKPLKPNDKYRPDRPGLQSSPFIANPYIGWDTDPILVLEGEAKSMVTFRTLWTDGATIQVVGIPGKSQFRVIADKLTGHDVYICLDPDAGPQAEEAARLVKGKVMTIPMKIDDAILAGCLNRQELYLRMKAARKV